MCQNKHQDEKDKTIHLHTANGQYKIIIERDKNGQEKKLIEKGVTASEDAPLRRSQAKDK